MHSRKGDSYDVTLLARNADQESLSMMHGRGHRRAGFDSGHRQRYSRTLCPASGMFRRAVRSSTSDDSDAIVDWSWDFAGWAVATGEVPSVVEIRQAGTWHDSFDGDDRFGSGR